MDGRKNFTGPRIETNTFEGDVVPVQDISVEPEVVKKDGEK